MKKSISLRDFILFIPFLLIPILGSLALGVILFLGLYLSFYYIFKKNHQNEPRPFKIIGIIFILYFSYYSIQGVFFTSSFWQHAHDIGKILPILIFGIFAYFIRQSTFNLNYKSLSYIAISSIYLTTFLALIFLLFPLEINILGETFTQKTGVRGSLEMGTGNALPFGTIFITLAFMTCLEIQNKTYIGKILAFLALIIGVLIVAFWNGSRGPILVAGPLTLLMLWYLFKQSKHNKDSRYLVYGLLITALLAFSIILSQTFGHNITNEMLNGIKEITHGGSHDGSVKIRLTLYTAGIKAFSSQPILGYGIGQLFDAVTDFLPKTANLRYSHLHNMFLNHMIAGGLLGLLFLFLLIFSPLINLWKGDQNFSDEALYFSLLIIIAICGTGMSNVLFFQDLLAGFFSLLIFASAVSLSNSNK